mmetsp:Transcript_24899/g.70084  ORF Transcript_24899/g.70084 Transcript_24899/m.70084 type:complete len:524 (-) Transcript_24899:17-1588(-)
MGGCAGRSWFSSSLTEPSTEQLCDVDWRRAVADRWLVYSGAAALKDACSSSFHEYALLESGSCELFRQAIASIDNDVPRTSAESFASPLWRRLVEELSAHGIYDQWLRSILVALVRRLQTGGHLGGQRGYTQGMASIAAILLVFTADPEDAFWLLACFVEAMVLPDFYCEPPAALNGALAEAGVVHQLLQHLEIPGCSGEELESVAQMLTIKMAIPFLVDCVSPTLMVAVWDYIFTYDHSPNYISYTIAAFIAKSSAEHCNGEGLLQKVMMSLQATQRTGFPCDSFRLEDVEALASSVPIDMARSRSQARAALAAEWERPHSLEDLQKSCHFTVSELEFLRARFIQMAQGNGEGHTLHRSQVHGLLSTLDIKLSKAAKDKLLDGVVDRDGSGSFDFREVVCMLSCVCLGTIEERLLMVFASYDADGSGFLEANEVRAMAYTLASATKASLSDRTGRERFAETKRMQARLLALDMNGDGKLSREEFLLCARADAQLLFAFGFPAGRSPPRAPGGGAEAGTCTPS